MEFISMFRMRFVTYDDSPIWRKHKVVELVTGPAKPVVLHGRVFVFSSYHTYHPTITQIAQFPIAGKIEATVDQVSPR